MLHTQPKSELRPLSICQHEHRYKAAVLREWPRHLGSEFLRRSHTTCTTTASSRGRGQKRGPCIKAVVRPHCVSFLPPWIHCFSRYS